MAQEYRAGSQRPNYAPPANQVFFRFPAFIGKARLAASVGEGGFQLVVPERCAVGARRDADVAAAGEQDKKAGSATGQELGGSERALLYSAPAAPKLLPDRAREPGRPGAAGGSPLGEPANDLLRLVFIHLHEPGRLLAREAAPGMSLTPMLHRNVSGRRRKGRERFA